MKNKAKKCSVKMLKGLDTSYYTNGIKKLERRWTKRIEMKNNLTFSQKK